MLLHRLVPQAVSVLQDFPVSLTIQYGQLLSKHPAWLICHPTASTLKGNMVSSPQSTLSFSSQFHSSLSSLKLCSCLTWAFNTLPCSFLSVSGKPVSSFSVTYLSLGCCSLSSRLCCCASSFADFLPPVPLIAVPDGCQICALSKVLPPRTLLLSSDTYLITYGRLCGSRLSSHSTLWAFVSLAGLLCLCKSLNLPLF